VPFSHSRRPGARALPTLLSCPPSVLLPRAAFFGRVIHHAHQASAASCFSRKSYPGENSPRPEKFLLDKGLRALYFSGYTDSAQAKRTGGVALHRGSVSFGAKREAIVLFVYRFLISAAAACISLDTIAQNVPVEEPAFTEFVAQAIRREAGDTPVSVKGTLTVSVGPLEAHLERIYRFCRVSTTACAAEVDQYAKGAVQVLKQRNAPLDKDAVRIVVRSSEYIAQAQASIGSDGPTLLVRPLVDGLVSVAVLDTPRALRPLNDRDLKKLAMSQEQLFELAGANVIANLKPLAEKAKPVGSGQIGVVTGSVYEVGRVALPAQWASLANAQHGTLVVALPTTDVILYISELTTDAIDALRGLARNTAAKSSNPLSPTAILKWTGEQWERLP